MACLRHAALLRTLTLFLLLWVGSDLGAHGFFASDFTPVPSSGSAFRLNPDDGGPTAPCDAGHCFCHSASMGAVVHTPPPGLTPAGAPALDPPPQVHRSDPQPLDRPPQLDA
jgi:hypothetical protein